MDGLEPTADEGTCFDDPPSAGSASTGRGQATGAAVADSWTRIARTIECEVIPRLMLSHRPVGSSPTGRVDASEFDEHTPTRLADMVLAGQGDDALAFVHALLADGLPLESIFLDLLGPAARVLGKRWEEDTISFTEVTIALTKMQRLMRRLAAVSRPMGAAVDRGSVLLTSAPGEQHLFGVLMLEEFFRRDGWQVDILPGGSPDEIISVIQSGNYRAVGISVSVDDHIDTLKSLIAEIRTRVAGRVPLLMVGGRCFVDNPGLLDIVGADFTAVDGREAIGHIHLRLTDETRT